MRPIVALLSDFGTRDHYAGAMKGAVLCACPDASVVDVAHDLPPHDVATAAYALASAYRAFPGSTVFLAVVDPGVGSLRRILAAEAGGYRFVAPDNGLLTAVLSRHADARIHVVTNAALFRHEVSGTFEGRDVMAPVAGRLAGGMPLGDVGPEADAPVLLDLARARELSAHQWEATVVNVDRFGNLTTSLTGGELMAILDAVGGDPTEILVDAGGQALPLVRTYSDVSEGEPCALLGSSDRLEIAVHRGDAALLLAASG
jgi:S-adenosylmethionine hydrolase